MNTWKEPCCRGCGTVLELEHPVYKSGVHPGLRSEHVKGGVVWWGSREPRVPQIMCDDCVEAMEKSGEFNHEGY